MERIRAMRCRNGYNFSCVQIHPEEGQMAAPGPDAAPPGGGRGPAPRGQAEALLPLVQPRLLPARSPGGPGSKVRGVQPRRRRSAAQVRPRPRSGKMPLGLRMKKKAKSKETARLVEGEPGDAGGDSPSASQVPPRRLVFHTQLAHGSATGRVENFSSIQELYTKIAEVFEISPSEVRAGARAQPLSPSPSLSHAAPAEAGPAG